jgi:hypothetical protein
VRSAVRSSASFVVQIFFATIFLIPVVQIFYHNIEFSMENAMLGMIDENSENHCEQIFRLRFFLTFIPTRRIFLLMVPERRGQCRQRLEIAGTVCSACRRGER